MLIVGELINTSREAIKSAVAERNADFIRDIARKQVGAGAHYVDVNCGTLVHKETETMEWLVQTVQESVSAPLCIDSPNPLAIEVGLALAKNGQSMVNSITAEKERFASILPLILKYRTKVVALCMDDRGMPETVGDRMAVVRSLVSNLTAAGIPADDIYLDPLVKPISAGDRFGLDILETVRLIRNEFPDAHVICGLSNISYGLPNRKVLNRTFMVQTMVSGMDAYIFDPLDNTLMEIFYASQALLGQDPFCVQYLAAYRQRLSG